jgi:diaminopimelate epimerase
MERFVKYQGLGNDFVILDRRGGGGPVEPERGRALCDRRRGIGADGVLTLLASDAAPARMHVTNADGSVAQMCGNGLRCAVKYLADEGGLSGDVLPVETGNGVLSCRLHRGPDGRVAEVTVDMGRPELEAERIPMKAKGRFVAKGVELEGKALTATAVSMGNPHLVIFSPEISLARELGPALERHPLFPERTNVEFARLSGDGLEVLVWERGCGITEACGTGACASLVAAVLEGRLPAGEERPVRLPGGILRIRVLPDLSKVLMRGPAERVFRGEVSLG